MISLVKNLKCISRLIIHYYPNHRYKSYITFLKAVIVGKSLFSSRLDTDRILHFVLNDKILQIYRQHWVRKFYRHILSKYRQIWKNWGWVTPPWGACNAPSRPPARHALGCGGICIPWICWSSLACGLLLVICLVPSNQLQGIWD